MKFFEGIAAGITALLLFPFMALGFAGYILTLAIQIGWAGGKRLDDWLGERSDR